METLPFVVNQRVSESVTSPVIINCHDHRITGRKEDTDVRLTFESRRLEPATTYG